ncbi:MAG: hypothetical protein U0903_01380 [Planctomycetales bacterium]
MAFQWGSESSLSIAQWYALDVADLIPDQVPTAYVTLYDEASEIRQLKPFAGDERSQLRRSIMMLTPHGEGKLDKLLFEAERLLKQSKSAAPLVLLVTDGVDCDPFSHGEAVRRLKSTVGPGLIFQVVGICDSDSISHKLRDLANQGGPSSDFTSLNSYTGIPSCLTKMRSLMETIVNYRLADANWFRKSLSCCSVALNAANNSNAELTRVLNDLRDKNAELQKSVTSLTSERDNLLAQNKSLSATNEGLMADLKDRERRIGDLDRLIVSLKLDNTSLEDSKRALQADVTRLNSEILELIRSRDLARQLYHTWLAISIVCLIALLVVGLMLSFRLIRMRDHMKTIKSEGVRLEQEKQLERERFGQEKKALEERLCELNNEIEGLKCRIHESALENTRLTESNRNLCHQNEHLNCEVHALTESDKTLQSSNVALLRDLECCRARAATLTEESTNAREQVARLEERLVSCKHSGDCLQQRNKDLEEELKHVQIQICNLNHDLESCRIQHEQDERELLRISTEGASDKSKAEQLEKQLEECQRNVVQQAAMFSVSKAEQALGYANTIGATREMAANKKECCPQPAPVISYNTPANNNPATPSSNPVGGGPSAPAASSAPGSAASSGPASSGPTAGPSAPASTSSGPSAPASTSSGPSAPSAAGPSAPAAAGPSAPSSASSGPSAPSGSTAAGPAASAAGGTPPGSSDGGLPNLLGGLIPGMGGGGGSGGGGLGGLLGLATSIGGLLGI